jgi:hypothetical protein
MTQRPTYLTVRKLALELNMSTNNMAKIIRKWRNHPQNPSPTPDAWYIIEDTPQPLWHTNRRPEWREWKTKRDTLVAELHAQEQANALIREALQENPTQLHLLGPDNE